MQCWTPAGVIDFGIEIESTRNILFNFYIVYTSWRSFVVFFLRAVCLHSLATRKCNMWVILLQGTWWVIYIQRSIYVCGTRCILGNDCGNNMVILIANQEGYNLWVTKGKYSAKNDIECCSSGKSQSRRLKKIYGLISSKIKGVR